MESLRKGLSRMDAAKGLKGHGWPLYAGPRSADGMREVERSETRMQGQAFLLLLRGRPSGRLEKVTRPAGRNRAIGTHDKRLSHRLRWPSSLSARI